jgi:hypothetical protein
MGGIGEHFQLVILYIANKSQLAETPSITPSILRIRL